MDLKEFICTVHKNAVDKGFYEFASNGKPMVNIDQKLLLIVGELIEAQECIRSGHDVKKKWYREKDGKPEGFSVELADAGIRLFDLAEALGLDLEADMIEKHAFNSGRPFKHGREF